LRLMRRILPVFALLILSLAGCNAPGAAFLDTCFPSRAKANPGPNPVPGVDVRPGPVDPLRPGPPAPPGPIPPPDFGPGN